MTARRALACVLLCVLLLALGSCGVEPVELAPAAKAAAVVVLGNVPKDAIDELARGMPGPADPMRVSFSYPRDGTVLPENLAPVDFQWQLGAAPKPKDMAMDPMTMDPMAMPMPKPGKGAAAQAMVLASELHVKSARGELRVYTRANDALLPDDRWRALLHDAGGAMLEVELRVLFDTHEIVRSKALSLPLRKATQSGSLYVWSTTSQGIVRAALEDTRAVHVAPNRAGEGTASVSTCGGCHAVSRDGRRLWLGRGNPAELAAYGLPALEPITPNGELANAEFGWASFDPTATRVALESGGRLRVFDVDSGAALSQATLPADVRVAHPDWSPDGRFIAVTLLGMDGGDDQRVQGSSIARVHVALDGSLGMPEVLVPTTGKDDTLLFPSYSPDGSLIAFERAKGGSKEAKDASLFLVAADGGTPIALDKLHEKDAPKTVDSMPTWLPGGEPGSDFLVFSSTRGYGVQGFAPGQEQLFATAIDSAKAQMGMDPSAPAFWLPFQTADASYHRALFARAQRACTPAPELCNDRDDDCDGRSDEACCTPAPEHCGDGVDDDCDGQSDEGCGCSFLDTCDDGVDNDCDGKTDEDCAPKP